MAGRMIHFPPSTNIAYILYDADEQLLTVSYVKSGAIYQYYQVPEEAAMGFSDALSATKYLEAYISSSYPSQRIA